MAGAIQVTGLRFSYGPAFDLQIERLEVEAGRSVACIGPSGCGKTTLLHVIAGILVPPQGRVVIDEFDVTAATDAQRRAYRLKSIGLVFQEFELLEHLTVRQNIFLPFALHPALHADKDAEERAGELAQTLEIGHVLDKHPHRCSHGERQRVAVARALVTQPAVVLADEPTGNLDPESARRTLDLMTDVAKRQGATSLVVTHDHSLLERFDEVVNLGELAGAHA